MKYSAMGCLVMGLLISDMSMAMRCGRSVVTLGDRKDEVLTRCGEPESSESHTKMVGITNQDPLHTFAIQQFEEIKVEEWIYNFGPRHFKQYLRFENSILRETKDLGWGS